MLLLVSISIDYFCANRIGEVQSQSSKRVWLGLSIATNLAVLVFFKYLSAFVEHWFWLEARGSLITHDAQTILLPLGISYYTLQSMGYTIDVYRGTVSPERHFGYFALYVAFFPQLVAGPIERPDRLLPQLRACKPIIATDIEAGAFLILFGLAKKLVLTDRLFVLIRDWLASPENLAGYQAFIFGSLVVVAVCLDISAYTDIARGSARLFGVELMRNFDRPFLARSQAEFFQRWHISLSSWLMDYFFRPLAALARARWYRYLVLVFTFALMGLWHGPTLPFVGFGVLNGMSIVGERVAARRGWQWPRTRLMDAFRWLRVQLILNISGVLFVASDMAGAGRILERIWTAERFWGALPLSTQLHGRLFLGVLGLWAIAELLITYLGGVDRVIARLQSALSWHRVAVAYCAIGFVLAFGERGADGFLYFDF